MVAGHVGQYSLTQQAPHLSFIVIDAGPRRWRELTQGTVLMDLGFAQEEILGACLGSQPCSLGPFGGKVGGDFLIADVRCHSPRTRSADQQGRHGGGDEFGIQASPFR